MSPGEAQTEKFLDGRDGWGVHHRAKLLQECDAIGARIAELKNKVIDPKIHVAIRSFGRADNVETLKSVPFATVWVPEGQLDDYRRANVAGVLWQAIPDECDGNLSRKMNSILDRSPCEWTLILDDDISGIFMLEGGERFRLSPDQIATVIEHHFKLADAMGVRLWGINQNCDYGAYRTYTPFSLLSPILGPFTGHLSPVLRYDESVGGKDDFDFWLQNIRTHRFTLRANKYHYTHDSAKRAGGWVRNRTKAREAADCERMAAKWGSLFKVGGGQGQAKGKILNSLVTVPIPGI